MELSLIEDMFYDRLPEEHRDNRSFCLVFGPDYRHIVHVYDEGITFVTYSHITTRRVLL